MYELSPQSDPKLPPPAAAFRQPQPRLPWDAADLFPIKPADSEYGYVQRGISHGLPLEELRKTIGAGWGPIPLVWTPAAARLIPAVESPELFEAVRRRLIRKMTSSAVRWSIVGIALAAAILLVAYANRVPLSEVSTITLIVFCAYGLLPAGQAARNASYLRTITPLNMLAQGRAARYEAWLKRKRLIFTWILVACIGLVAFAQNRIGWDNSIPIAALLKPLPVGQWWRLLTCVLMHGGWLHLGINLFSLVILGRWVEAHARSIYLPLVFTVSALAGSLASLYFTASPTVGASGGLMGLIGFLAVMGYRRRSILPDGFFGLMLANVLLISLLGFAGRAVVDNSAHAGGCIAGALIGMVVFRPNPGRRTEKENSPSHFAVAGGLLCTVVLVLTSVWTTRLLIKSPRPTLLSGVGEEDLGSTTVELTPTFFKLFTIPGKFVVLSAKGITTPGERRVVYSMSGRFLAPGLYVFPFEQFDDAGAVFEVRYVRVRVLRGAASQPARPMGTERVLVSPDDSVWPKYHEGATLALADSGALVTWTEQSAGQAGRWRLKEVVYIPVELAVTRP